MSDVSVILVATLAAGLVAVQLRLPPLVGFLVAGFGLHAAGVPHLPAIDTLAELGVTLLLFGIGLRLNVRTLARREVWVTAAAHLTATTVVASTLLAGLALVGVGLATDAGWRALVLVGFALSFSSTVFVVKVLEERSAAQSTYGRTAIGILVIQDLAAVVFLTITQGELPSPWALLLVLLVPGAWLLRWTLGRLGHGEMQVLFGVVVALVPGFLLFETLGIKGDLGALVMGMLLAPHPRSGELSKMLFSVKELLLVGFFLSIGFTGLPSWENLAVAVLLVLLVPLKAAGFVLLLWWQGMRHRTSTLTGLSLANYSEFGLIVVAVAASANLVDDEWLVVLATAVALSFLLATGVNGPGGTVSTWLCTRLPEQDPARLHVDDRPIDVGHARAVVLGMGRVGRAAYEQLEDVYGLTVVGVDNDASRVAPLRRAGFDAIVGDATDPGFWSRLTRTGEVELAILAMPFHGANLKAMEKLDDSDFAGTVAVVAQYDDEMAQAHERGAHTVFQLYDGAGVALADRAASAAGLVSPDADED